MIIYILFAVSSEDVPQMIGYWKPKHEHSYFNNSVSLSATGFCYICFYAHVNKKGQRWYSLLLFVMCLLALGSVITSGDITVKKAGVNPCSPGAHIFQGSLLMSLSYG